MRTHVSPRLPFRACQGVLNRNSCVTAAFLLTRAFQIVSTPSLSSSIMLSIQLCTLCSVLGCLEISPKKSSAWPNPKHKYAQGRRSNHLGKLTPGVVAICYFTSGVRNKHANRSKLSHSSELSLTLYRFLRTQIKLF